MAADPGGSLLPMTDAEIRAVEQASTRTCSTRASASIASLVTGFSTKR
jgi:hypothetical protein